MRRPPPSLHALALFRAAVELGTVTAAAAAGQISQPAVTAHIRALERHFGTPLLERRGRRVYPTAAGRLVAGVTGEVVDKMDGLARALADLKGVRRGKLDIGASATIGETLLPAVLGRFRAAHPGVEFALRIGNSQEIARAVADRALGLGLVGGVEEGGPLVATPAFEDALAVFGPASSPYAARAARSRLRLADLSAETLILREAGSATRDLALRCLAARGFAPARVMEFGSNEAVKRAVAAGIGIGILSSHTLDVDLRAGDVVVLPCRDWDCRRRFWLIRRRDHLLEPVEQAFVALLTPELEYRHGSEDARVHRPADAARAPRPQRQAD